MQIAIKYESTTLANDPDYDEWDDDRVRLILRCQHDNLVVEPPCCSGADCACNGQSSLYCPDCKQDLIDREIEDRDDQRGDDR